MLVAARQQERSQCDWNRHLFFAGCVNEITLHPRPASRSFAGNVETDHPQVALCVGCAVHGEPRAQSTINTTGRCRALLSCQSASGQPGAAFNIMSDHPAAPPQDDHKTSDENIPFAPKGPSCVHKVGRAAPLASQSGAPSSLCAPDPVPGEPEDWIVSARRGTPGFPGILSASRSEPVDFRGNSASRPPISYQSVMEKGGQFLSSTN